MNNKLPEFFKLFDLEPGDRFNISDGDYNPYELIEGYQVLNCENTDCSSDELFLSMLYGTSLITKLPKVTEKEDRILHALYDLGWKWLARDKNGFLMALSGALIKTFNAWHAPCEARMHLSRMLSVDVSTDFQFIKWEDEEPFRIEKYVEEYGQ